MPARQSSARPGRFVSAPLLSWDQYAARWASLHGGLDPRRARPSVLMWLRASYVIAKMCARVKVKPAAVTMIGLIASVLVPVFAVHGPAAALLAAVFVAVAAVADTVDGALAVLTSHTTRLGYVYDAVAGRLGELFWLLALWRLGAPASATVAAGALTWLHEYVRSRANAAGMGEIGSATLGERPTRVFISVVGLALAGVVGLGSPDLSRGIATFAVVTWLALAAIGFAQLFSSVHRALAGRDWPTWRPQPMARIVPVSAPPATPVAAYREPEPEPAHRDEDPELDEVAATMGPSTTIYASESVMHTSPIGLIAVGFDGEFAEAEMDASGSDAAEEDDALHGRHSVPEPKGPTADGIEPDGLAAG